MTVADALARAATADAPGGGCSAMVDGFGSRVMVGPVVAATRYGVPLGAAIRWRLGYRHGYPTVRIGSGGLDEARHHGDDGGQETS